MFTIAKQTQLNDDDDAKALLQLSRIDDWKGDENTIDAEANVQCLMLMLMLTRRG